jgi:hypothetical protein
MGFDADAPTGATRYEEARRAQFSERRRRGMCKMISRVAVTLAAIIGLSIGGRARGEEQRIVVEDRSQGCFHSTGGTHSFVWRDGAYLWQDRRVSESDLNHIRQAILQAPREPQGLLKALGVTPERVAEKRNDILAASLPRHWRNDDGSLPQLSPDEEHLLAYEVLAPDLLNRLTCEGQFSTTSVLFRVSLPGSPPLEVESTYERPCMLPFTVKYGDETWRIYDVNVPRMLKTLADPWGPNYKLLDGFAYWSQEVWNDGMFWLSSPGRELDRAFSTRAYKAMKGYEAASQVFRVKKALSGCINMVSLSIHLDLEVREPKLINRIWWWVPLQAGRTQHDWLGLIDLLEQAEEHAGQNEWVLRWRAGAADHTFELHAVGYRGYAKVDIDKWVLPPWQDARLRGVPKYEFCLRDEGHPAKLTLLGREWGRTNYLGTCYLGDEDGRMLVTHVTADNAPWPGIRSLCFHPKAPSYAIVNADGSAEMRCITKQDSGN